MSKPGSTLIHSNIWASIKHLRKAAGVMPFKVFPHNLRKIFARTFYAMQHEIAKLAGILERGSVNTARLYIMTGRLEYRKMIGHSGLASINK